MNPSTTIQAVFEAGVFKPIHPVQGLTEGQPVQIQVELSSPKPAEADAEARFLNEMKRQGILDESVWSTQPPPATVVPMVIPGPPLSQSIIEDRG